MYISVVTLSRLRRSTNERMCSYSVLGGKAVRYLLFKIVRETTVDTGTTVPLLVRVVRPHYIVEL